MEDVSADDVAKALREVARDWPDDAIVITPAMAGAIDKYIAEQVDRGRREIPVEEIAEALGISPAIVHELTSEYRPEDD